MKIDQIKFVQFDEKFLEDSWFWLNDNEIRHLIDAPEISKKDQKTWFDQLNQVEDYKIWGIQCKEINIGACGLKHITSKDAEYWGYIGNKSYWGKGFGNQMINYIITFGQSLNLKSIWLKVISENDRAISLYKKHGFIEEKILDGNIMMRKEL